MDGRYEVRITEELSEVSYLDQMQLIRRRPSGRQRNFHQREVQRPTVIPSSAYSACRGASIPKLPAMIEGAMCCPRSGARPAVIPTSFRALNWAWRSAFARSRFQRARAFQRARPCSAERLGRLARRQHFPRGLRRNAKGGLVMPYLQMQDAAGEWLTVNEDMGMPAGKPKTIAVPLHFISEAASCGSSPIFASTGTRYF